MRVSPPTPAVFDWNPVPEGDVLLRAARRLHHALAGDRLTRAELRWGELGSRNLVGMTVNESVSYGKNSLIRFDSGLTLHSHLKMDGTWWVERTTTPPAPHRDPRIRILLGTDEWTCVSRLTGAVHLVRTRDEGQVVGHLGPDLLGGQRGASTTTVPDFPGIAASAQSAARRLGDPDLATIGAILLNQRIAAGIGTIYLAESLWITRVHPHTRAATLPLATLERIYRTASALMARSAEAVSHTATGDLRRGRRTHVHGRERLPCRRCGQPLAKTTVGRFPADRPAFFCPGCQPRPD